MNIHGAFARRVENGVISTTAVLDILEALGNQVSEPSCFITDIGLMKRNAGAAYATQMADVAKGCSVALNEQSYGRPGYIRPFRLQHVIYFVWLRVVRAIEKFEANDTPVVALATRLVLAALAVENPAGVDDAYGEDIDVDSFAQRIGAQLEAILGAPVSPVAVRDVVSGMCPRPIHPFVLRGADVAHVEGRCRVGRVDRSGRRQARCVFRRVWPGPARR